MSDAATIGFGTAAAFASGGPPGAVFYLGGELVASMVDALFASAPEGDDRPMPFGCDGCAAVLVPVVGAVVGREPGNIDPEYAEAFERLDTIISLAAGCNLQGLQAAELQALRAEVAKAMNAGITVWTAGSLSPYPTGQQFYKTESAARPTRGQVRAWLGTLSTMLGKMCSESHLSELAAAVSAPLDVTALRSSSWVPRIAIAVAVVLVVAVVWGTR